MRRLLLLPIVLSTSLGWAGSAGDAVLRDLGPDKSLGVAMIRLQGANSYENQLAGARAVGIIVGSVIVSTNATTDVAIPLPKPGDVPSASTREDTDLIVASARYSQEMANEFLSIFEGALGNTGAFQVRPSSQLIGMKNGAPLTMAEFARENGLFASVNADAAITVALGWKKKLNMKTEWLITTPLGAEIEISTKVSSREAQGMFPDSGDPKLKPVLLQMARDTARQFLDKLSELMKKSGCAAQMKLAELDDAPQAAPTIAPSITPSPAENAATVAPPPVEGEPPAPASAVPEPTPAIEPSRVPGQ